MDAGVVEHHHRQARKRQGKSIELFTDPSCRDLAVRQAPMQAVVAREQSKREQSKAVDAPAPLAWHHDRLARELPGIRHTRQQRHAALVAVEQVNVALLRKPLELGQALGQTLGQALGPALGQTLGQTLGQALGQTLALERIDVGIGLVLYLPSNALEAATVFLGTAAGSGRRTPCPVLWSVRLWRG